MMYTDICNNPCFLVTFNEGLHWKDKSRTKEYKNSELSAKYQSELRKEIA